MVKTVVCVEAGYCHLAMHNPHTNQPISLVTNIMSQLEL